MPSEQKTLYSQGLNFASYIKDGVDQRTGQCTFTVSLFDAPSEARNLPPLKLSLTHNPLNPYDAGFGKRMVAQPFELPAPRGAQGPTPVNRRALSSHPHRLPSGVVETLSNASNTYKMTVPIRLDAANGRSLTLRWSQFDGEPRLSSIQDGSDVLLRVDYQYPRVSVTRAPDSSEKSTLTFRRQDHNLREFKTPTPDLPPWRFSYQTFPSATCVTTVYTPTGLVENITYKENGHRLPPGSPYQAIPCVKMHVVHPGNGQPSMRTIYTFSTKNFMGYGSGYGRKEGEDNLYRAGYEYEYTSTASVDGGTQTTNTLSSCRSIWTTRRMPSVVYRVRTPLASATVTQCPAFFSRAEY
ncbi:hypothetical protein BDV29DRAFT_153535 [Aspergillus leporis]|uniref:Uncharacterized protein n=1 Tax=Aspergillus leporis TaxID=41062 RepID=A0A5N5XA97_9EURO|nr:hypothetical protein BDV29DRAFT_153535 [Aspergillus leporis]